MSHLISLLVLMTFSTFGKHYSSRIVPSGREELELILGGRAVFHHNDQTIYLGPGDVVWHKSGDRTISSDSASDDYECLIITFAIKPASPPPYRLLHWNGVIGLRQFAEDALNQLDNYGNEPEFCEYLYNSCKIHSSPFCRVESDLSFPSERAFNQAYQFIAKNFMQPSLTVNLVADAAHISLSLLHAIFKERTGMTPHQKMIQFRMERALEALLENRPKKQVAVMTGFSSESGFTRAFKKYYGSSPAQYRLQSDNQKNAKLAY